MTIKELYEKAVQDGTEDYDICLQYQDGGGSYCGDTDMTDIDYRHDMKEVVLA